MTNGGALRQRRGGVARQGTRSSIGARPAGRPSARSRARRCRGCTTRSAGWPSRFDTEHQRAVRRRQIEAYDVADLVHEERIAGAGRGSLKVSERCGCKAEGRPYPPDRRMRQPALPGHRTERPVGRVGRRRLQRPLDDRGHLIVRERSRPSRSTRLIRSSFPRLRCATFRKRRRHLPTVCSCTPSARSSRQMPPPCPRRADRGELEGLRPSAQRRIMRQRSDRP